MQYGVDDPIHQGKVWVLLNPSGTKHWVELQVIRKLDDHDGEYLHFTLDDNPILTEEVKESFRRSFANAGAFGLRMVQGVPADEGGLVYPAWHLSNSQDWAEIPYEPAGGDPGLRRARRVWGLDYGVRGSAFALIGARLAWYEELPTGADTGRATVRRRQVPLGRRMLPVAEALGGASSRFFQQWHIDTEVYYDPMVSGEVGDPVWYNRWVTEAVPRGDAIVVDPATPAVYKRELEALGYVVLWRSYDPRRDLRESIAVLAARLGAADFMIDVEACPNLAAELGSLNWSLTSLQAGDEKPEKGGDHACDALRYLAWHMEKRFVWDRRINWQHLAGGGAAGDAGHMLRPQPREYRVSPGPVPGAGARVALRTGTPEVSPVRQSAVPRNRGISPRR